MNQPDEQWTRVLERGVGALDFRITSAPHAPPVMALEPRPDARALPAMIQAAVQAAIEVDRWVAKGEAEGEAPIPRAVILARKDLAAAKAKEPPGSGPSPFTAGYAAAYKVSLADLLWSAIADHPVRRLQALAAAKPPVADA
jgi:hypothetical protein